MLKKGLIKSIAKKIKASKGFMTAKGKLINYREAHRIQYGIVLGLITFRPRKIIERTEAHQLDFLEWEKGNIHYQDQAMLLVYSIKMGCLVFYAPEMLQIFL